MAGSYPSQLNLGSFVPTTNVWDVNQIYSTEVTSPEFKELLVRLYQNINNIAINLNLKDTGYYDLQEFVNGQKYFFNPLLNSTTSQADQYRQVFRMVVNCGTITASNTYTIAHNIAVDNNYSFTRIYGCASNAQLSAPTFASFIPLPYPSATSANIVELSVDETNITIITGSGVGTYTKTYVVLEYIKQ